jgi:hypothetical protein
MMKKTVASLRFAVILGTGAPEVAKSANDHIRMGVELQKVTHS